MTLITSEVALSESTSDEPSEKACQIIATPEGKGHQDDV